MDENNDIASTEPEKPEGLDQQKLEGSEAQKTRNIKGRHEQDKIHVTKNKRRRERQKRNKHNFMNKHHAYENSKYRNKNENEQIKVGGGAAQDSGRRRPLPRLRQKERPQGNWVKREREREQNKLRGNNYHNKKLARAWTRTPPSGEPGEPRWRIAKLRTPSPKPEVRTKRDTITTAKNNKGNINYNRGIGSEVAL